MSRHPLPAKALLAAQGMHIKDVANAIQVSHHWLGRVLNGHEEASADLRRKLSQHLNVQEDELFEGDIANLLRRTRTDRGMALVIDDPAVIAKLAAILAAGGGGTTDAA